MRTYPALTISLLLLLAASSCKKNNNGSAGPNPPPPPPPSANVYVLGVEQGAIQYWKNGNPVKVDSQTRIAYSFNSSAFAVSHGDVYVAGYKPNINASALYATPVFWLDGVAHVLPDSSGNAYAESVFLTGGDVYIAGTTQYTDSSHVPYTGPSADYPGSGSRATLWKNGSPVSLPGFGVLGLVDSGKYVVRSYSDYVSSMYISGTDVYVSGGSYWVPAHAQYWKNGQSVDLNQGLVYTASNGVICTPTTTSLFVSGNDVYVTGFQTTSYNGLLAIYWKNGTHYFLSTDSLNGSSANSVFVSGTDVYIAGYRNIGGYSRATIWKNGVATLLTSGTVASAATSVFVSGTDVYVAGYRWANGGGNVAAYWKNGKEVDLSDGKHGSMAYSIFVE